MTALTGNISPILAEVYHNITHTLCSVWNKTLFNQHGSDLCTFSTATSNYIFIL